MAASNDNRFDHRTAGIGAVCLHWADLERSILGCISILERTPYEIVDERLTHNSLMECCDKAIRLSEEHKVDARYRRPLILIRDRLSEGVEWQRNFVVNRMGSKGFFAEEAVDLVLNPFGSHFIGDPISDGEIYELGSDIGKLAVIARDLFESYIFNVGGRKTTGTRPESASRRKNKAKPFMFLRWRKNW